MAVEPVGAIAEGVGKIFGFGTSFVDKAKAKREAEGRIKVGAIGLVQSREAEREKSKRTMLYAGLGVFIVVIALVGLIVYVKNK